MKFYLRYVNPVLALAVLVIGLMSASLEWKPIEDIERGEVWKEVRWVGFFQDTLQTYFLAKTIFCSAALFLLGKLTEHVIILTARPADGSAGAPVTEPLSKKAIVAVVIAVAALLTGLAGQSARRAANVKKLDFEIHPTIHESSQPLGVEEAREHVAIPLPPGARNIQYATFSAFLAHHEIIRFEATLDECKALAERIVSEHNRKNPTRAVEGLRPLKRVEDVWPMSEGWKATWFTPQEIRRGFVAGTHGSHQPLMWIDANRGVFYFQHHD